MLKLTTLAPVNWSPKQCMFGLHFSMFEFVNFNNNKINTLNLLCKFIYGGASTIPKNIYENEKLKNHICKA